MPKNILLADDSVTIQKVVELTFSEGDYHVTCVSNGKLALQKIQEQRPDILLCDVIMPELNGYEVCSAVKHTPELAGIPVVLMTGTFEPFDEEKARQAGADTFVTKPFESKLLVEKVEELLKKRMILDTTIPMESAQIFQSRQEFTLQAPVPSDEELLASERAGSVTAEAFESPFLPAPVVPPEPVQISSPAPPALPAFAPTVPPQPPKEDFGEVFAPPPSIAPAEFAPPPPWEPPVSAPPPFEPVPEVPSPAEALFQEMPRQPAAFEETTSFAEPQEPELPPFQDLAPDAPLEVVHDMMDQEDMVSRAQGHAPDTSPDMPPFEGLDEAPPLEMPYESLAPAPVPEASSVDFPGAPEPQEEEVPLTSMAFGVTDAPAAMPAPQTAVPGGMESGEALFEAVPSEAYAPADAPYPEPEAEGPATEVSPAQPEALEAPSPAQGGPWGETRPEASTEEAFGGPAFEETPAPAFVEPPEQPWEPPVPPETPPAAAEEVLIPAVTSGAFTESPAVEEAPAWEPSAPEEPPPAMAEVPSWETPTSQEAFAVPEVQDASVAPAESAFEGAAFTAGPDVAVPILPEAFSPPAEMPQEEPALSPAPSWMEEEPSFPAESGRVEEVSAFPTEPAIVEEVSAFSAESETPQEEPAFPPQAEIPEEEPAFPPEPDVAELIPAGFAASTFDEPAPAVTSPEIPVGSPTHEVPSISAAEVEAMVRRVVAEMAPEIVRQVAWEVIPELAESLIKRRIRELESAEE